MKNPFIWLAFSLLPFLPGCLSKGRIEQKLEDLTAAIRNANVGRVATWGGVYSVKYDTTYTPAPVFFAFALDSLDSYAGQVLTKTDYDLTVKYDSVTRRVFGYLTARPVRVTGWSTIRLNENLTLMPGIPDSVLAPGAGGP